MEEGSFRCDANVSLRKTGASAFGTKTEIKNMNSFRNVERALEFEIRRQTGLLEEGGEVVQETLLWDANQNAAYPMRGKEGAHDYRYFPEPDLLPVRVDEKWIRDVAASLPEDPTARRDRFVSALGLPRYDADVLTAEKGVADYFEAVLAALGTGDPAGPKSAANWVMTDVLRFAGDLNIPIGNFPVTPANLAAMIRLIGDGTISGKIAKEVFAEMLNSGEGAKAIVERRGLVQLSDPAAIGRVVDEVLAANAAQVEKYRAGNEKVFGFFVGEVMKATKGKANPKIVNDLLRDKLAST
jgi:aspartyl-tRNA(Asn)/glutamyl-tRNA(Gln) amidotransferase subunit B